MGVESPHRNCECYIELSFGDIIRGILPKSSKIIVKKVLYFCGVQVFDPVNEFKLRDVLPVFVKQMFKVRFSSRHVNVLCLSFLCISLLFLERCFVSLVIDASWCNKVWGSELELRSSRHSPNCLVIDCFFGADLSSASKIFKYTMHFL